MRTRRWFVALLAVVPLALGAVAPVPDPDRAPAAEPAAAAIDVPSPLEQRQAILDALIVDDFQALVEAAGGADDLAEMAAERKRDAERTQQADYQPSQHEIELDRVIVQLGSDAGVEALVAEWQPLLAEQANAKVLEFNLGLAAMMNALADDENASAEDLRQRGQLILAIQAWANRIDWNDAARLRRAIGAAAGFVRKSGAERSTDFATMPFEDLVIRLDDALRAVKDVLAAYDLDVDAMLRSVTMKVLSREHERARIHTEVTILGVPLAFEEELRWHDGEWKDAGAVDAMERWEREQQQGAVEIDAELPEPDAAGEPAAEPTAEPTAEVPSCKAPANPVAE